MVPDARGNPSPDLVGHGRESETPDRAPGVFFRQIARSIAVSLLSFAVDLGILVLLTEVARIHYLVSAAFSFLLGTTVSYALSILWVFEVRSFASRWWEYAVFVMVGVVGLGLNEALLWAFTESLGIYYIASKLIAASLVFFWNFGARRWILFR
jgi:putative flippase GtrA